MLLNARIRKASRARLNSYIRNNLYMECFCIIKVMVWRALKWGGSTLHKQVNDDDAPVMPNDTFLKAVNCLVFDDGLSDQDVTDQ